MHLYYLERAICIYISMLLQWPPIGVIIGKRESQSVFVDDLFFLSRGVSNIHPQTMVRGFQCKPTTRENNILTSSGLPFLQLTSWLILVLRNRHHPSFDVYYISKCLFQILWLLTIHTLCLVKRPPLHQLGLTT